MKVGDYKLLLNLVQQAFDPAKKMLVKNKKLKRLFVYFIFL